MAGAGVPALDGFRVASPAGIFLDFDGTLSDIVARPELAQPRPKAASVLALLVERYAVVAVVSGRPADEVRARLDVPGVIVFGRYGLPEGERAERAERVMVTEVERAAARVRGAWVEDKGPSLAVHFRRVDEPEAAEASLRPILADVASRNGYVVLPGRRVLELAPSATPGKGAVVAGEVRSRRLRACLYAGDDHADLDAFAALDGLAGAGVATIKVAVRSEEAPQELIERADMLVDGPAGLLQLLATL
jgi:trehalose 6-phosphate phosphatase